MNSLLKVGIIGASAKSSWAKDSHVPALQHLPGLELVAVATIHRETARAAAQAFGAREAFANGLELTAHADVDIVSVCVKVPAHRELVLAALEAGKHVYCEWPLGANVAEAQEMRDVAVRAGVHVAIGLQARLNPAVREAKALLDSGTLGHLLSARVYSSNAGWGPEIHRSDAYLDQTRSGANLVTILGGHTLDLAEMLLGEVALVSALATTRFPEVRLLETGETIHREVADNLSVLAHHQNGCVLNAEIDSNRLPDPPFRFEIIGTQGTLELIGGDPHGFQGGRLQMHSSLPSQPVAPAIPDDVPDSAVNVAELYAQFAKDIRENTRTVPDFAHAARLTHLIEDVLQAAASGQQRVVLNRPAPERNPTMGANARLLPYQINKP